jgi:hypothetical protein
VLYNLVTELGRSFARQASLNQQNQVYVAAKAPALKKKSNQMTPERSGREQRIQPRN